MPAADINATDYYRVLGVDRGASQGDIGKAYKKMARKHHPDKNPDDIEGAEARFKLITQAYEVLNNPTKRREYDQFGKAGLPCGPGAPKDDMTFGRADDIFKSFFSHSGGENCFSFGGDDGFEFPGGVDGFGFPGGKDGFGFPGGKDGFGFPGGNAPFQNLMFSMPFQGGGFNPMPDVGGKCRARSKSHPPYALPLGTSVVVRGLMKAPEHNGKSGTVKSWDDDKKRYEVEINDDISLSLKPSNLTQTADVEITGVASNPDLNGTIAEVIDWDESRGRYTVRARTSTSNGKQVIGLEPSKVILRPGTRVITQRLSDDSLNGLMANIKHVDCEALKYTIVLKTGKNIKVALDKVLC